MALTCRSLRSVSYGLVLLSFGAGGAAGQTPTYHLHNSNGSNFGTFLMSTAPASGSPIIRSSGDLKNHAPTSDSIGLWTTSVGVPGMTGQIQSQTVITFTFWMRKTSLHGTVYPSAWLRTVESLDVNLQLKEGVCEATGTNAINSTTFQAYAFSCTVDADVPVGSNDRWALFVGFTMTQGPGNKSMKVELQYEGSSDSRVQIPNPTACGQPNGNDLNPDTDAIQCLLDLGGTLTLDADVSQGYLIGPHPRTGRGLVLRQNYTTLNSTSAFGYSALLKATPDLADTMLIVDNSSVSGYTISHIFFHGDRFSRPCLYNPDGTRKSTEDTNVALSGNDFVVDTVTVEFAVCASGMSVQGSNFRVINSWFAYNGWPGDETDPQSGESWSDGLTVLNCNDGSIIEGNHFVDNTDVDLIVGGGSGCSITDNHIDHYQTRGFAGLMVESFLGAGDHSGVTYSGNIVTSTADQLAFGIMVGHHPWNFLLNLLNVGSVQGNTASGAVINLQIEASSGIAGGQVTGNTLSGAQGTSSGGFYRCSIVTNYAVYEPHAVGIVFDPGYEGVQFDSQVCTRVQ